MKFVKEMRRIHDGQMKKALASSSTKKLQNHYVYNSVTKEEHQVQYMGKHPLLFRQMREGRRNKEALSELLG